MDVLCFYISHFVTHFMLSIRRHTNSIPILGYVSNVPIFKFKVLRWPAYMAATKDANMNIELALFITSVCSVQNSLVRIKHHLNNAFNFNIQLRLGALSTLANIIYLCRRFCQSEYLLCWRSHALWDRLLCTLVFLVLDIPRSQRPKQRPLSSSTCLHGIDPAKAHHTHPHATSCSTARYANLQKVIVNYFLHNWSWKCEFQWICALSLPTHVRPVLSKVRPSAHSQRKEPCVFTQRPFVHTPGNTSHSFMSTETFPDHHTQSGMHFLFKRSLQGKRVISAGQLVLHVLTFTDKPLHPSKPSSAGGVWGDTGRGLFILYFYVALMMHEYWETLKKYDSPSC